MPDLKIDPDRWHDDQVREKQKSGVVKQKNPDQKRSILKDRDYYSLEDVAAYIHQYHQLPNNYITKAEAEQRNWTTNDERFVIGGDRFGNREGKLPKAKGRYYYEADIQAGYSHHRGPERIVFSNDGLIYYTNDHYETFDQLYGKEVSE
ncbi:hypothetical protein HF969_02475 [Facklamia miroungae]|nr:hypothetical protein [Facklamia miroungae]